MPQASRLQSRKFLVAPSAPIGEFSGLATGSINVLLDAINSASAVLISPSNPLVSVGTILSLAGVRDALRETEAKVVGVSPIVGGATIKGPADRMMRGLGMEVSAVGVARAYADFLDVLVIDRQDAGLAAAVEAEGVRAVVTDTIMRDLDVKRSLARITLEQAGLL